MIFYNKRIFERCFNYPKRYWYMNLKQIPLYIKLMRYLNKHGYDEYATWETYDWFIYTMKEILLKYRNESQSIPIVVEDYSIYSYSEEIEAANETKWYSILDRMIELLDLMDEDNPKYSTTSNYKYNHNELIKAKNEFFELFAKYFYNLWD